MKKTFQIDGMHCAGCAGSVEKAIRKLPGIKSVSVDITTEKARVEMAENVGEESIREAVEAAGFQLPEQKREWVTYSVDGMHCAGCRQSVERAILSVNGVHNAEVNLASETARVEMDFGNGTTEAVIDTVEKAGYTLSKTSASQSNKLQDKQERERVKLETARRRMMTSWVITAPLMVWMFLDMVLGVHLTSHTVMELAMTAGAAYVIFFPGWETLRGAWRSATNLSPNMDVLIAIGTLASLFTGVLVLAHYLGWIDVMMFSFAGIAAMIMAFHLTGRYIENKAKGRASDAITKLLTLEATTATLIRNGEEVSIDAKELRKGHTVLVRPGETIPADGTVVHGKATVDESMITGESVPVLKEKGSEVIGGTINHEGSVRVEVTGVGEETFLNKIITMVEEAQGSKIPIQDFADRVVAVFVPIILGIALLTFLSWWIFPGFFEPILELGDSYLPWVVTGLPPAAQAFFATLAVLVIACPCALGLATPTALMVGSGLGAENGILIRRGEAIQTLQESTLFVFDKTGTLTKGEPDVTGVEWFGEWDGERVLAETAAVERLSEHPLSKALVRYAGTADESVQAEQFESFTGMGVKGEVNGRFVVAGNRALLQAQDISIPDAAEQALNDPKLNGQTSIFIAVDNRVAGIVSFADTLKPNAAGVIAELKQQGIRTMMLTGDQQTVADAIAGQLGMDEVIAEVRPDEKAETIRSLQEKGYRVAMVGDGVNDAPALTQADVGIALGTGTDIAIESGSIILVNNDLKLVLKALDLSRATMKKIRQNLFWAFIYNIVMIPISIIGWMHPVLAEIAMAASSVSVIGNSRSLQKKKI